jgi:ribonuclease BN (tRNA processing enzyme)
VRLTVVGCSGSFPGPGGPTSCYLVEADGKAYVLDLGNGSLGGLARHTDIYEVEAVLVTHLHPDHFLDLCGYYVARAYHPTRTVARLPVHGPPGIGARLAQAYGGNRPRPLEQTFDFREWADGRPQDLGGLRVTAVRVAHSVEAYAIRIEHGGRSVVYSGDTGPCDALVEVARDADLLLCEASHLAAENRPPNLHLTGREAAEHATKAGVRSLVLTHVPPWHDPGAILAEARPAFDGPVDLARPGAVFEL